MLPYTRIYLKLIFYYGGTYADNFLQKYKIVPPNEELLREFFASFLKFLDKEQKDFFLEKPFHTIADKGRIAKSIIEVTNHYFSTSIEEKVGPICNRTNERILKNRQLRIFIEILILGNVPFKIIEKALLRKFRLNPPIKEEEIKDYSFWFFEPKMMDDYDWQIFWELMSENANSTKDRITAKEVEDKKYCFRRESFSSLLRMGVGDEMNYVGMLKTVGENIYSEIERDWENGSSFSEVEKKYKMLKSIGSEYFKHTEGKENGSFFEDFQLELAYHTHTTVSGFQDGKVLDFDEFKKTTRQIEDKKEDEELLEEDDYGHLPD